MDKNNSSLFYTCSLIEFISRQTKNKRKDVINYLGEDLERIYNFEDVFHCEPIEKVSDDFIKRNNIPLVNLIIFLHANTMFPITGKLERYLKG